jgi:hypothetical protein
VSFILALSILAVFALSACFLASFSGVSEQETQKNKAAIAAKVNKGCFILIVSYGYFKIIARRTTARTPG